MSHFAACELLQQFRGFQRVGLVSPVIFAAPGLEPTE
jgi:hypothetical protein